MVELDNESSLLTTFNTPWGKYKWLRLPFGLRVSADVLQERLNAVLKEVEGITGCIDDILTRGVHSKDHDVNLLQLLETARMNRIKFNPKKLQFKTTKCDFFGQTTDNRLDRTRIAITADPVLNHLSCYIFHGWPLQMKQLPGRLQHYWNYRKELAFEDGLIFKAHRLVIPTSLTAEYLKDLHAGHLGEEKTLLRARETVFWPGISDDVRNAVKLCDVCMKYKPAQQKEPLVPHDVPSLPWFKLEVDIFGHRSHHYLLVADYFNKFPFVKKLTSQTAGHVIRLLKTIFSEYGVPATVYTDQGTQFVSQEFKQFALQYRFEVQHSSPRYPQSNGFIEAMVKVVKGIMEKAEESGSDPHLAMQIYRATPIRPGQLSPGEMLSQRKYRALLPIHQYLHPNPEINREAQIAQKQAQRDDYDRTAKKLQDLQSVRFQLDPKKPI